MPDILDEAKMTVLEFITSLSLDALIIGGVIAALIFFGIQLGRDRLVALLLAEYVAIAVFPFLPFSAEFLGDTPRDIALGNLIFFLGTTAVAYICVARATAGELTGFGFGRIITYALLVTAIVVLGVSASYHIFSVSALYNFGPGIDMLFAAASRFFWWLVAGIVILFLSTRSQNIY